MGHAIRASSIGLTLVLVFGLESSGLVVAQRPEGRRLEDASTHKKPDPGVTFQGCDALPFGSTARAACLDAQARGTLPPVGKCAAAEFRHEPPPPGCPASTPHYLSRKKKFAQSALGSPEDSALTEFEKTAGERSPATSANGAEDAAAAAHDNSIWGVWVLLLAAIVAVGWRALRGR